MSVIHTAYSENSLQNIYQPQSVGSWNPSLAVLREGSTPTNVLSTATVQNVLIQGNVTGTFSKVFPVGTSIVTMLNSGLVGTISEQSTYINGQLFENLKYSTPISISDSVYAETDATSALYKKIYSGNDVFVSSAVTANNDKVCGYDGNDIFYGFGDVGEDLFDGATGVDTSVYRGVYANYTLVKDQSFWNPTTNRNDLFGIRVVDKTKLDGSDGLVNVERLQFTDTTIALDIGANQTAGSGYMLYKAAFNRTPDVGGLGYWISKMDGGMSYSDVSKNFVTSTEFKTAFCGSNPSVNTLVTKLYNNVLNRTPDAGGLAFWQDKLNTGWSTADVLGFFSTSGENVTNVTPLIANGISYTQYVG